LATIEDTPGGRVNFDAPWRAGFTRGRAGASTICCKDELGVCGFYEQEKLYGAGGPNHVLGPPGRTSLDHDVVLGLRKLNLGSGTLRQQRR